MSRGRTTSARPQPAVASVLAALLVSGCAGAVLPRARETATMTTVVSAAPAPEAAPRQVAAADRAALTEQMTRIATELNELQNAVARLIAISRDHDGQLQALHRRLSELAAATPRDGASLPPSGFAPSPPTPAPATSSPTATPPEELYRSALGKVRARDVDGAILTLYDLIASYPTHPLRESAQFMVADIFYDQRDLKGALAELEGLLAAVPNGQKTPEALLRLGLCQRALGDEGRARANWERLVKEYPKTAAARQAGQLLRRPGPAQ